MVNSAWKVKVTGELFDSEGNLKQRFVTHNLITSAGYDFIANCFGSSTRPAAMLYLAVGTTNTAAALADTALKAELKRQSATYAHTTGTTYFTLSTTFAAGVATGALVEAGIFNASSGGTMFDRVVYPVINKDSLDTYKLTFQVNMSEA